MNPTVPPSPDHAALLAVSPSRERFAQALAAAIAHHRLEPYFFHDGPAGSRPLQSADLPGLRSQDAIVPNWPAIEEAFRTGKCDRRRLFLGLIVHLYNAPDAADATGHEPSLQDFVEIMQGNDSTNRAILTSLLAFYPGW